MLAQPDIEYALSVQDRSFKLLQWLGRAIRQGFVPVTYAHEAAHARAAAQTWIKKHYCNLPVAIRPSNDEITAFANFFGTFLETSFDLETNPRDEFVCGCGCFCPSCCRLANPHRLKPKKLTRTDKERAAKLRLRRLDMLAREESAYVAKDRLEKHLADESMRHATSLSAYGSALLDRLKGIADGPGVLALWRDFAWKNEGSPKQGFVLKGRHIIDAEKMLLQTLLKSSNS